MTNTSEINEPNKLEILFENQLKILTESNMQPSILLAHHRAKYISVCWDEAMSRMDVMVSAFDTPGTKVDTAELMLEYSEMFIWVINIGIYIGITPRLLFDMYKFGNDERLHGFHS